MSLMKVTSKTLGAFLAMSIGFFLLAGPYYMIITSFRDICLAEGNPTMNTFIAWSFEVFYWGYPSVYVFGIIMLVVYSYRELRRRYYSTEEAYYGS